MERFMPLIKQAVVSGLIAQATHRSRRDDLSAIGLIVMAGFILVLAMIFGSLAAYNVLEQVYSEPVAFSVIGAALLGLSAMCLYAGLRILRGGESRSVRKSQEEISRLVDVLADDLSQELSEPIRENPKTAMAAATIAGFLVGDKLH